MPLVLEPETQARQLSWCLAESNHQLGAVGWGLEGLVFQLPVMWPAGTTVAMFSKGSPEGSDFSE
jgi:hypothetical protein